ncbi:hypothetical protein V6N12_069582 [Hibiscus sabdariffa]|uniref:Uncharacterized protein n=1 Tax=Hibiscus sabdariffa TaxID=183260 RepID=A0ABR2FE90_9ROSI
METGSILFDLLGRLLLSSAGPGLTGSDLGCLEQASTDEEAGLERVGGLRNGRLKGIKTMGQQLVGDKDPGAELLVEDSSGLGSCEGHVGT